MGGGGWGREGKGGRGKHDFIAFKSFLASGHFCHLLITFANSLDPDQDQQNVGPDLDPNHLTL